MKVERQASADMERVAKLIESVGVGMLTTPSPDGAMHSRPMQVLKIDEAGCMWFFTDAGAHAKEAGSSSLNISFADPKNGTYVSVVGSSELRKDKTLIDELWSPVMKAWFPEGRDDSSLALLKLTIHSAEYWDASNSKMVRMAALAASAAAGKQIGLGENETVHNK